MLRGGVVWTVDGESAVAKYGSVGNPRLFLRAVGVAVDGSVHSVRARCGWMWKVACGVATKTSTTLVTLGGPIYDGSTSPRPAA